MVAASITWWTSLPSRGGHGAWYEDGSCQRIERGRRQCRAQRPLQRAPRRSGPSGQDRPAHARHPRQSVAPGHPTARRRDAAYGHGVAIRVGVSATNLRTLAQECSTPQTAIVAWLTLGSPHSYTFPADGGVAQLGERYNRTVEVGGSSPPASTEAASRSLRPARFHTLNELVQPILYLFMFSLCPSVVPFA